MSTKRDTVYDDDMSTMQEILYGAGQLIRHEFLASSHVSHVITVAQQNEGESASIDSTLGKDAVYWNQIALTLDSENQVQRDRAQTAESELAVLRLSHNRIFDAHQELQKQHATTSRELAAAQADAPLQLRVPFPVIPIDTEGRDAVYWHQVCRTLQAQVVESKRELDLKTEQFVVLAESVKRK